MISVAVALSTLHVPFVHKQCAKGSVPSAKVDLRRVTICRTR